jgi:outer membrane protein assembly factor BamA
MVDMHFRTAVVLALATSFAANSDEMPPDQALEIEGAVIGRIVLDRSNVFDLSNPEENNALYRLANRWHIVTKAKVIQQQLLFESGDAFSAQLLAESGRILRQNQYLYDATIKPLRASNGVVDISVATRDVWSLGPDISFSRKGGENRTGIGLEETNLLGRGQTVRVQYEKDVDRTSNSFEYYDRNFGNSWVSTSLRIADNSDGKSNWLSVIRPFYALDARWSAGGAVLDDDRRTALYQLGEEAAEYQHRRRSFSAFGGWSKGLDGNIVRRWTVGIVHDDNQFSAVPSPFLPLALPSDRKLVYGFARFELVTDEFEISRNRDQIGRTEDFLMGTRFSAMLGWSDEALGADRDALIYSTAYSRGFGSLEDSSLLLAASASGRVESGEVQNSLVNLSARYYRTQSEKRLFFATLNATAGNNLDLDNPVDLGGDNGIRGYPQRYQSGDSKMVLTIEQRYFTDWYPFRLARVGGAIFADAGRVWGQNPLGGEPLGWLTDIGFGLRLAPTRSSSRKMVHIDIAFPLDGADTIDSVQFSLEAKRSF